MSNACISFYVSQFFIFLLLRVYVQYICLLCTVAVENHTLYSVSNIFFQDWKDDGQPPTAISLPAC